MKNKLFIHVGTWKTGSSTIQHNLYNFQDVLYKEGFYYLCKKNKLVVDDNSIGRFTTYKEDYVNKSRKKLRKIVERELNKNSDLNFISSAEEFSGNPFDGFKNAPLVAKHLKDIVDEFNFDVQIIIYLRRQDEFLESLYTQSIHLGASHSFSTFIKQFDKNDFVWYNLVKAYSELFGKENVHVKKYHNHYLPNKNSLLQSFGQVIGSDFLIQFSETKSKNKGLSRDALEIVRITNRSFDKEEQYKLKSIFQEVNSKKPLEKYGYFSVEDRNEVLKLYESSNSILQSEFFKDEQSDHLFPHPNESENRKNYEGLSTDAALTNMLRALLVVQERSFKKNRHAYKTLNDKFIFNKAKKAIKSLLNVLKIR